MVKHHGATSWRCRPTTADVRPDDHMNLAIALSSPVGYNYEHEIIPMNIIGQNSANNWLFGCSLCVS